MTIMSMSLKPTTTTTPTATGTGTTSGVAVTVDYAHHVRQATTTDVTEYPVGGEDEAGPAPDTRLLSDLGKSHGEVLVQTRVEVEGDKRHSAGRAQEPHGWAGGANEEEPDLDLLLALSGGAKTNNPFGFEKVGKGASGRPRRQFEDEGDFYVPSL